MRVCGEKSRKPRRRAVEAQTVAIVLALGALGGCGKERGPASAEAARTDVNRLVELTNKDVAEIERGLPEGAKRFSEVLAKELGKDGDPKQQSPAVRTALLKMRQQVPDLGVAKSTFFAFADDKGIAVRNDFEPDTMAGKDLLQPWPEPKAVLSGTPYVSTTGQLSPNPAGPDKEWVAAVPLKKADGTPQGMLVTGWTYRRFAYHLQITLQRDLQDQLMQKGDTKKMPIVYVCLFDNEHVYGAQLGGTSSVPEVDTKALSEVGLYAKTEGGQLASSPLKITDRDFGWAAARLPKLAADVGVVVLRSEI